MALFRFKLWPINGPNLIAAGVYPLRGWYTLLVWLGSRRHSIAFRLPVRVRAGQ